MRNLPITLVSAIFKEAGGVGDKSRGAWHGAANHASLLSQCPSSWTETHRKWGVSVHDNSIMDGNEARDKHDAQLTATCPGMTPEEGEFHDRDEPAYQET
jgi:hypothetical protein